MPVIEVFSNSRGRPNLRLRTLSRAAAPWWAMSIAVMAVLAIGVLTFPPPTGAVSVTIDGAGRPASATTGSSATSTATTGHPVALPATMALTGAGAQIRVLPMQPSAGQVEG